MISQIMLGAFRQQAITWTNVDEVLWDLMVSLGLNEFRHAVLIFHNSFSHSRNRIPLNTTGHQWERQNTGQTLS